MKKILLFLFFLLMSVGSAFSINTSWNVNSTRLSSLIEGDTVVWGTSPTSLVYTVENNWAKTNTTKSGWLAFKIVKISGSFYLQELNSNKYVYSSADKKIQLHASNKTSITLNANGYVHGGSSIGTYTYNSSGIRPYKTNTYTAAYLYKVSAPSVTPTTYTVTYNLNGGSGTLPTESNKTAGATFTLHDGTTDITPPANKEFSKWKDQDNQEFSGGATYTMPSKNVTLTAQWQDIVVPPTPVEGESFELLIDIENLEEGDEIVILNTDGTYALSTTQNNNNRGASNSFTLSNNVVTLTDNDVQVITVGGSTGAWTFYVGDGYLYAASSSANHLKTQVTNNANGEWAISLNGSYEASIVAQGTYTRNVMQYNSQSTLFSCYSSASQTAIKIYKKVDDCEKTVPVRKGPETNGTFSIDKTEICADSPGGTVTITDIAPANGYTFDNIVCVTAKVPITPIGTVNLSEKKVTNITDSCYIFVTFKENPSIDIVEWNPDWLKIDVENFTAATATLEDQNTQADIKENIATELFFSKYFEAESTIKMLGIYNGKKDSIDLSKYIIKAAAGTKKTTWDKKYILSGLGWIHSGEEIVLYSYDANASDIVACVNNYSKTGFDNYIRVQDDGIVDGVLNFNGDDAIGLFKINGSDTTLIDIIGAGNSNSISITGLSHTGAGNSSPKDTLGHTIDMDCWITDKADNSNGYDNVIGTNLCLLIRKSIVHSGDSAVKYNTTTFETLASEWIGKTVSKGDSSTCKNFDYVGTFDYNNYYIDYDTIKTIADFKADTADGYYKISIPQLDTLSCTNLKITVKDESNNELEKIVKIPIMIKTPAYTDDDDYFDKKDCDKCDVVVLKDMILTSRGDRTNRDVKLYEGAELVVDKSSTYTLNSLSFRRYNDSVSSLFMNGGTLNVTDKVYFDLYITPDDWHYIALPTSYTISNVKYVNGKTPAYGEDYLVRHYDGKYRAENLKGGWKNTPLDSTFNAGNGFIFGLSDDHKKKEFRFEFNNSVITAESSNKTVSELHAWGGNKTDEELRPNHKGWNLIGNPFLGHFNAEIFDKIRIDSVVKVIENGKWTGQWELSNTDRGKSLRYAVIPSDAPEDRDAGGYKSVVLDDMQLLPFTCFFVQIGGNDESAKGIEFKASRRSNRIVARNYQEDEDDELFLRVKVDNWKTGCFISNKFTDKYEPGDDLESRYPIYQSIGGYKLLYSAINDSIIEHGITITAPSGKLVLDQKVNINNFEYIYVKYGNSWYNLLQGETVDIETGTFILQAKRKNNDIPTGIDAIPTKGIYKFTDGKYIYINRNGELINVLGNKIK